MNDYGKPQNDMASQDERAHELIEQLNLLEAVDRRVTPDHVARRFHELLASVGPSAPADVNRQALREPGIQHARRRRLSKVFRRVPDARLRRRQHRRSRTAPFDTLGRAAAEPLTRQHALLERAEAEVLDPPIAVIGQEGERVPAEGITAARAELAAADRTTATGRASQGTGLLGGPAVSWRLGGSRYGARGELAYSADALNLRTRRFLWVTITVAGIVALTHQSLAAALASVHRDSALTAARAMLTWPLPRTQPILAGVAAFVLLGFAVQTGGWRRITVLQGRLLVGFTIAAVLGAGPMVLLCALTVVIIALVMTLVVVMILLVLFLLLVAR